MTDIEREGVRSRIAVDGSSSRPSQLIADKAHVKRQLKALRKTRHKATKVAFCRYGYYEPAFRFFTERVLLSLIHI